MTKSLIPRANPDSETRSRYHHESHRTFLTVVPPDPRHAKKVDAIIVPTGRPATAMRHAIELAAELRCALLALCSKLSSASEVTQLAKGKDVEVTAIDVGNLPDGLLPRFDTDYLMENSRFDRHTDTSLKRNVGLLIAHLIGWQRVVFLDDDITVPDPQHLRIAAGLTDRHDVVGLNIGGYPDNSVVCHAYREAGGPQSTFIGGGAIAVGARSMKSFFPNIYNEDWFFLLGESGLRPLAVTGSVIQEPYNPFAAQQRARLEELGDCLAEGLFSLLDVGKTTMDATHRFWQRFLTNRRRFIDDVIAMVADTVDDSDRRPQMLAALRTARRENQLIRADQCLRYLAAWQADRGRWRQHLADRYAEHAEQARGIEKLMVALELAHATWHSRSPQRLDEDAADLSVPLPVAVGQ